MKCYNCGYDGTVNPCKCLVIKQVKSFSQIEESLIGIEDGGLCESCVKELALHNAPRHPLYPLQAVLIGIGVACIIMMIAAGETHPLFIAIAAVSLILGLIVWRVVLPSTAAKYAYRWIGSVSEDKTRERILDVSMIPAPVGEKMYRSRRAFDKLNPNLTAGMREKLYTQAITNGLWKRLPDARAVEEQQKKEEELRKQAEEKARQPLPDISDPDFFPACVERLVWLYQKRPGGYLTSQADEVREVGRKLNEAGGMDMMLEAHAAFARQNGLMARNLEMVWDGIGSWAG